MADIFMKVPILIQSIYLTSLILQWRKISAKKWDYKSSSKNGKMNSLQQEISKCNKYSCIKTKQNGNVTKTKEKSFIRARFQSCH